MQNAQLRVKDMQLVTLNLNEHEAYQSQLKHQIPFKSKLLIKEYFDSFPGDSVDSLLVLIREYEESQKSSELANQLSFLSLEEIPVTLEDVKKITDKKLFLYRMGAGFLEETPSISTLNAVSSLFTTKEFSQQKRDFFFQWLKNNPEDEDLNKLQSILEKNSYKKDLSSDWGSFL